MKCGKVRIKREKMTGKKEKKEEWRQEGKEDKMKKEVE